MKRHSGNQPIQCTEVVEPGDIFYYSWGYDQTNVEFFQVLSLTKSGKSGTFVKVKAIQVPKTGMMSGTTTPDKDNFEDNALPFTKRITESYGKLIAKMDYSSMAKWDGQPKHYSCWA